MKVPNSESIFAAGAHPRRGSNVRGNSEHGPRGRR